jgi:hypothetical protein
VAVRPLQLTPFLIAKYLTPQSFTGIHLLLMLASVVKIVAGNSIGYFLFRNRKYALALGLLFLLFPADTQQMSLRTMNHSVAAAMMVGGIALALRVIVAPSRSRRVFAALASILLCCTAPLLYEAFFVLYICAPCCCSRAMAGAAHGLRCGFAASWLRYGCWRRQSISRISIAPWHCSRRRTRSSYRMEAYRSRSSTISHICGIRLHTGYFWKHGL